MHWESQDGQDAGQGAPTIVLSQSQLLYALGGLCIALPVTMIGMTAFLSVCRMSSLSHYYYVPIAGNLLVGWLVVLAGLLCLLRPASTSRLLAYRLAALMLVLMAVFPISGDGCARSEYTGLAFYHYDYAHPKIIGVTHHLSFVVGGLHLSNHEIHIGAGMVLACLLMALCFDWRPVQFVRTARKYGYGSAAPTFWTVRNLCCLGVALGAAGASVAYLIDSGWVDGYKGGIPPELAYQSCILLFFGAAMLGEARRYKAGA
ncbi:hypothetical protein ACN2XU_02240 [Primorskyibacter sp. 2E107]|uniref:hypothetical protein n=1 Tax=Primorskyibacter sp. 2E107 TaxID=3403458 RepID=UPI003AF51D24